MPRFRHKRTGTFIDAMRWDGSIEGPNGTDAIEKWSHGATKARSRPRGGFIGEYQTVLQVQRPNMVLNVGPHDWVARGPNWHFPISNLVLETEYDPVQETQNADDDASGRVAEGLRPPGAEGRDDDGEGQR
jgi:hypothetical protein